MDVDNYREMFNVEFHHNHEIIRDEQGTVRWKADPRISEMITKTVNLNDLWYIFHTMGLTKNDEKVRKLYRDMGYSLSGYWEIFFWSWNNEDCDKYKKEQMRKKRAHQRKVSSGSTTDTIGTTQG